MGKERDMLPEKGKRWTVKCLNITTEESTKGKKREPTGGESTA